MNQSISGTLYATFANGTCYFFETDEAHATENTWKDTVAEEQSGDDASEVFYQSISTSQGLMIDHGLRRIMESVRIGNR